MNHDKPLQPKRLANYTPPPFLVETVQLAFDLNDEEARVHSRLELRRAPGTPPGTPLILDGRELELVALALDGAPLPPERYHLDPESLTLPDPPESFILEVETRIFPQLNTALEGLYRSGGIFCTQCEAEGFRKITYYPDRPDVLSRFTTTVRAERRRFPVLLSNGNPVEQGALDDGRHFATWEDPFPKPAYLFALVAGELHLEERPFLTQSGRKVALRLYVEPENAHQCEHALNSLAKAMRWDEERYGREYDLEVYMIVAVKDFNMGAMENKGLNLFNAKYVLAVPETASDGDYEAIENVIAHEYFHNWTGNRITCRDWFQLTLKEGLTVFRDQQFSAEMSSGPVQRIQDVRALMARQFPEDAGPTAHPVQPDSYIEINNFYTSTVYEKGAEVVRMIHTLLGEEGFRRGMDLYFQRHDGQAVTVEDFVAAHADANQRDFSQFMRWYQQAGTPELRLESRHDPVAGILALSFHQTTPPTPGQPEKFPLHLPIAVGLLNHQGQSLPVRLAGEPPEAAALTRVLELREGRQTFHLTGVAEPVVVSALRGFSAPVKLEDGLSESDLAFLWAHDPDPFNRWRAGHELASRLLLRLAADQREHRPLKLDPAFSKAFSQALNDPDLPPSLAALALTLPGETVLLERMESGDPEAIHAARQFAIRELAAQWKDRLVQTHATCGRPGPYRFDPVSSGLRALKNLALGYLVALSTVDVRHRAITQLRQANNMTDRLGALQPLVHYPVPERVEVLASFHEQWRHDPLVMDKWLSLQATAPLPDTLKQVRALMTHPAFSMRNPNKVRALIGAFASGNPSCFHHRSGDGYRFLAEQVAALDRINPQTASRLAIPLTRWRRLEPVRREKMRLALQVLMDAPDLSRDLREIVSKGLA
ncbi:MAG: aminopeptidase N [Magnetococcales bacterium]|nr:aminopeptidase N [Magnetococcales bacterium]